MYSYFYFFYICTTAIISILKNTLAKKPGDKMRPLPPGKLCYFHLYLSAPHALQKKPDEEHRKRPRGDKKMQCLQYHVSSHHSPSIPSNLTQKMQRVKRTGTEQHPVLAGPCSLQSTALSSSVHCTRCTEMCSTNSHKLISTYFYVQSYCPLNISIHEWFDTRIY